MSFKVGLAPQHEQLVRARNNRRQLRNALALSALVGLVNTHLVHPNAGAQASACQMLAEKEKCEKNEHRQIHKNHVRHVNALLREESHNEL